MTTEKPDAEDELLDLLREQHDAMVAASTERLAAVLADDFVAVHITGDEQSRQDWLAQIASGRMRYHGIREESARVALDSSGDRARVLSRAHVDATIWGSRVTWPLESLADCARIEGAWRVVRSRSITY